MMAPSRGTEWTQTANAIKECEAVRMWVIRSMFERETAQINS